jgi:hypothetical protein
LWDKLDAKAIAEENGAVAALLNGPRYWLMSSIGKVGRDTLEHKTFGGLEMIRQATVRLATMNPFAVSPQRSRSEGGVHLRCGSGDL